MLTCVAATSISGCAEGVALGVSAADDDDDNDDDNANSQANSATFSVAVTGIEGQTTPSEQEPMVQGVGAGLVGPVITVSE